ncbi:MAG TPA: response regulator [Longimicrobium sp.]
MNTMDAPRHACRVRGAPDEPWASPWEDGPAEWDGGAPVLVADAHEDSRAVCAMLLRHAGFTVLEAATGEEAIRLAHARRPGAIVLSAVLHGVDGMRALAVLKQHPATAPIPVVMLSSVGGDEQERDARAAGCAAYLLKPCVPRRVLDAVRSVVAVPA